MVKELLIVPLTWKVCFHGASLNKKMTYGIYINDFQKGFYLFNFNTDILVGTVSFSY